MNYAGDEMVKKGYWSHYCLVCKGNDCGECDRTKMTYEPQMFEPLDEETILGMEEKLKGDD